MQRTSDAVSQHPTANTNTSALCLDGDMKHGSKTDENLTADNSEPLPSEFDIEVRIDRSAIGGARPPDGAAGPDLYPSPRPVWDGVPGSHV